MSTNAAGIWELGLVFGAVLGLLVWELVSIRRTQRRDERKGRNVSGPP